MIAYPPQVRDYRTPNGRAVRFHYRADTNDHNTLNASLDADEYRLRGRSVAGWAVDIGGYLGSVGIGLAVDHPALRVLIVEPVPDNVELIERNAAENSVADRVSVFAGAVGPPGVGRSEIRFRYTGSVSLEHHAFVGNSSLAYDTGGDPPHEARQVETLGIADLLDRYGIDEPALVKIDCEGGEWAAFDAPLSDLLRLPVIVGEVHPVRGHVARDLFELLGATHAVTLIGPNQDPGPCGFEAVRRA